MTFLRRRQAELRFVHVHKLAATHAAEEAVCEGEALQADGELHVAGRHHVLDLEVLRCTQSSKSQLLSKTLVRRVFDIGSIPSQGDSIQTTSASRQSCSGGTLKLASNPSF